MNKTNRLSYWKGFRQSGSVDSYIEATLWSNGEGFDIEVSADHSLGERSIKLTWAELDELKEIIEAIYEGEE